VSWRTFLRCIVHHLFHALPLPFRMPARTIRATQLRGRRGFQQQHIK
jgi:hypothetical protein